MASDSVLDNVRIIQFLTFTCPQLEDEDTDWLDRVVEAIDDCHDDLASFTVSGKLVTFKRGCVEFDNHSLLLWRDFGIESEILKEALRDIFDELEETIPPPAIPLCNVTRTSIVVARAVISTDGSELAARFDVLNRPKQLATGNTVWIELADEEADGAADQILVVALPECAPRQLAGIADRFKDEPFLRTEMAWHRIRVARREYHRDVRPMLKKESKLIERKTAALLDDLGNADASPSMAHANSQQLATAYLKINQQVIKVRGINNRFQVHSENLRLGAKDVHADEEQAVCDARLESAETELTQVGLDLAIVEPKLNTAQWAAQQHQTCLLTGLLKGELEQQKVREEQLRYQEKELENQQREIAYQKKMENRFKVLAVWLGISQIAFGLAQLWSRAYGHVTPRPIFLPPWVEFMGPGLLVFVGAIVIAYVIWSKWRKTDEPTAK